MHSNTSSRDHFSFMQSNEIVNHVGFPYFICAYISTVETHMREPVSIRNWVLEFHYQNPLIKNTRDAETGNGSYIRGVAIFNSEFKD